MDSIINYFNIFKTSILSFILSLVIIGQGYIAFASAASERPDKPFLSSIPALFLKPQHFEPKEVSLTLYPERSSKLPYADRNRLYYTYALQNNPQAPIVFIIPGLGSFAFNHSTLYVAESVYQLGYSVITLPSTTHWSFAVAASSSGRTGYLPDDTSDMYRLMGLIKSSLVQKYQIAPRQWGLLGWSYGGLDSVFVLAKDLQQQLFNFDFLLMISPPLSRTTAIAKADQYFSYGEHWPSVYRNSLKGFALGRATEINSGQRKIDTYNQLEKAFPLKEPVLAWIMASEFRHAILNTAQMGNFIENQNTLLAEEAFKGSITNYLRDVVYKSKLDHSDSSLSEIENASELTTVMRENANQFAKKKIILFHSTNDFFSFPESENLLNQGFYESHIYGFGGHLGYISDQSLVEDLKLTLLKLKNQ